MWYKRTEYEEAEVLKGILDNDEQVFRYIYRKYYDSIRKLVLSFRNLSLITEDIFQEGLSRAVVNIRNGKFNGDSSFLTYLSAICRNICRKELSGKQSIPLHDSYDEPNTDETHLEELIERILQLKKNLNTDCIRIIDLRFGLNSEELMEQELEARRSRKFEEIAALLNIHPDNARQRFGRCLETLKKLLHQRLL